MIRSLLPAPLSTGKLGDDLWVVRDGFVNCYLVRGPGGWIGVDAGWRAGHLRKALGRLGLDPAAVVAVLLTHTHWDHAGGTAAYPEARRFTIENLRHSPGERLEVAGLSVRAVACPGHTADSMAYLTESGALFTGDSLWLRGGRAHANPWWMNRDHRGLQASLRRLARLDGIKALYTAHSGFTADASYALDPWREAQA